MLFGPSLFASVQPFSFEFEVISYQTVLQLCFAAQTYCIRPEWYRVKQLFNCFLSKANLICSPSVTICKGGRLCLCRKEVFSHQACHCKTGAKVVDSGN